MWTIGFGHAGPDVVGGITITGTEADEFLSVDLHHAELAVYNDVDVVINQNEFDALVSLIYNIGTGAFAKSTVLHELNAEDRIAAADAFLLWCKTSGQVNQGLLNRRKAERALFLTPEVS